MSEEKGSVAVTEPNTSRVTIVIPIKNEEKTILKLLESLEAQTYNSFEVIIVDGCSTDQTTPIIEQFIQYRLNYKLIEIEDAD